MTVSDLIERLEDMNPDSEVRLMTQEQWPFENSIRGVTTSTDLAQASDDDDEDTHDDDDETVYIVEGRQLGYGNKNAWNIAS